jgi:hypothetical protein
MDTRFEFKTPAQKFSRKMPSPFISTLSYHGINISIVGNRSSDMINDPSFVKEVSVGENGELIVGLEDIREGRVILSIPKNFKTNDILEKVGSISPSCCQSYRN